MEDAIRAAAFQWVRSQTAALGGTSVGCFRKALISRTKGNSGRSCWDLEAKAI